jgi:hypothetical protein
VVFNDESKEVQRHFGDVMDPGVEYGLLVLTVVQGENGSWHRTGVGALCPAENKSTGDKQ